MTSPPEKDNINDDTNYQRQLRLKKYLSRCKLFLSAAAGMIFFTDTDLILGWEKIVIVVVVILLIIVPGYTSLILFEGAIDNVKYDLKREPLKEDVTTGQQWPKTAEGLFHMAAILTTLLGLFLLGSILCHFFNPPKKEPTKPVAGNVKIYRTSSKTFKIGPFVQGYDSLAADQMEQKLDSLKRSLTDSPRKYTEIAIYGGVDKRPLKGKAKLIFGDNITLAQSRAEWTRAWLERFNFLDTSCLLLTSVVGARKYSSQYSDDDLAFSRYVFLNCKYVDSTKVKLEMEQ